MIIRDCRKEDIKEILDIYNFYIDTLVTFEEEYLSLNEMQQRFQEISKNNLPYLVAEIDGRVVGYAYATIYRPRSAYRYTLEESVYVDNKYKGQKIGDELLKSLINHCTELGYKNLLAVIVKDVNDASIKLHQKYDFKIVGELKNVGFKQDMNLSTIYMQKIL